MASDVQLRFASGDSVIEPAHIDEALRDGPLAKWRQDARRLSSAALATERHGNLADWKATLDALPETGSYCRLDHPIVHLGQDVVDSTALDRQLKLLSPWRKGPWSLGGVTIDTEWRSDWKWNRIAGAASWNGADVLDIGCGNGYFGWRMLGAGARRVVGVDPTLLFVAQSAACHHFANDYRNIVLPLSFEDLPTCEFPIVVSMGVLYHRKSPMEFLSALRSMLAPGGTLILETLVVSGNETTCLVPAGRYAQMRNVWFLPSTKMLRTWLHKLKFTEIVVHHEGVTHAVEQRSTAWMPFHSLSHFLDTDDARWTIEGHPAPLRAVIVAKR